MEKPKISVILTTFERPERLKKAIKSVLKQTFQDWELIIYDDYSQDGKTPKICEKFAKKDSRIRYIRGKFNSGTHAFGKNQGAKVAKADLIAYLDDDNEYRRDHLQVLYKYLGDYDIVYGDRWLVDETGRGKNTKGISRDFNAQLLSVINYIDTSDVLVRKKCLEAIGGWDESLPKFADWNLWVRLAKAGFKFKRIPIIITDYHVHEGCNQFRHGNRVDPTSGRILPTFDPAGCKIWPDKTSYGARPKLKVAVFTLTMDRLEYTKRMAQSMFEKAGYPFDWFVVDNGSKDGTKTWLTSYFINKAPTKEKKIAIKWWESNEENVGISRASNQALDIIEDASKTAELLNGEAYDIIIKVDNDCLFLTDNWLKEIVDIYERQRRIIISPRVEGLRDSPGGVPRTYYFYVDEHFLGVVPHLGGICVAAPAEIYKDFRWEENDFLHGEQDYIFSQYARKQGYLLAYDENIIVEHMDTTWGQEKKYPDYFKKREYLKTTKYGEGSDSNSSQKQD